MNKTLIAIIGFVGLGILFAIVILGMGVSFHNREVKLRNLIVAKQADNRNEMDAMWKNISQSAQVAEEDRASLMEIFNGYASGRQGGGESKAIFNWIKEACPKVSSKIFTQLMNVIVSQRDGFKFRQKEILDFKREHDNLIDTFPNNIFACILGRNKIDVVIVTSTRTENAFKTGKDDETQLFGSPASTNK
jgi:hypothetical protein